MRPLKFIFPLVMLLTMSTETSAECFVTATDVQFALYDIFAPTPTDSTGTITVACNETPPPVVMISIGPSSVSGGFNPRRMRHASAADVLDYNIFIKPNMLTIWGDGTAGTDVVLRHVNRNVPKVETVYVRIPPNQDVAPGDYTDTLTVTITW